MKHKSQPNRFAFAGYGSHHAFQFMLRFGALTFPSVPRSASDIRFHTLHPHKIK
jgi:hypothetical protein